MPKAVTLVAWHRYEIYTRHGVPRWSPDGREIVFEVSWKETGEYEPRIFKVPADGGRRSILASAKCLPGPQMASRSCFAFRRTLV